MDLEAAQKLLFTKDNYDSVNTTVTNQFAELKVDKYIFYVYSILYYRYSLYFHPPLSLSSVPVEVCRRGRLHLEGSGYARRRTALFHRIHWPLCQSVHSFSLSSRT